MKYLKRILLVICLLFLFVSAGCSKVYYHYTDAVRFRLENESSADIYAASVSFGNGDTVFGSMSGQNADGTALANKGKNCLVFSLEEADLNDTELTDMVFDFFVCTEKNSDFRYVGEVTVNSPELHKTYTLVVQEDNERLILTSSEVDLTVILPKD